MKKGTIIALIVAILLIIAGCVLLVLGLSFAGNSTPKSLLTQQEVTIAETFDSVLIDTGDCNVTFVPFKGAADTRVVIREREATSHSVLVEEGTLKIRMMDNRQWTDYIGINWESMEMTVYLPETEYASLRIMTSTGDIKIPEALSGKEVRLQSDTGEVYCNGRISDLLSIMTDTGDIQVHGCAPEMMQLESDTGDIKLSNIGAAQIHLKNDTGETALEQVSGHSITCESSTGDVDLNGVLAEVYLQIFTSTGDIDVENSDAATVNIETDTGDVEVPAAWKLQRIESDTGRISYE